MTIDSREHANLASHSYGEDRDGKKGQMQHLVNEKITLDGVTYKVLEYMDKPSGYQGAIYQRVDTGEIVVAHRGTEFGREPLKDGATTDAGMAIVRTNAQVDDAIELTRHALKLAKDQGERTGYTPEVTVTGHSLGGTLAEITAYKFNLRGETFNSYGAVSLGYHLPEGGSQVINHVKASDVVSAGSHHFGQVRMYASAEDVRIVRDLGGYSNDSNPLDIRSPGLALVGGLAKSHNMHHFTNVDGDSKSDRSILADPNARQLAEDNRLMFEKFRNDVHAMRTTVSVAADITLKTRELAGHAAGQNLQAVGHTIQVATHFGAQESGAATFVAGVITAKGVDNTGNAVVYARETAAAFEAKINQLQGYIQKQGATLGAGMLRDFGSGLPDIVEKGMNSKAEQWQKTGDQAHLRNQTEAADARHAGQQDAGAIRGTSQKIQAGMIDAAAQIGGLQHRVIHATGERVGVALAVTGQITEVSTRRPASHAEQVARKEPIPGTLDAEKATPQKNAPADSSAHITALSLQLERMLAAGKSGDWATFHKQTQLLANGDAGQAMRGQAITTVDKHEQQIVQQLSAQQAIQQEVPAMRHAR